MEDNHNLWCIGQGKKTQIRGICIFGHLATCNLTVSLNLAVCCHRILIQGEREIFAQQKELVLFCNFSFLNEFGDF